MPRLSDVLQLAQESTTCDGDDVGVYIELKHPSHFDALGLSLVGPLVQELEAVGLDEGTSKVIIQSGDTTALRTLAEDTNLTLMLLVGCGEGRWTGLMMHGSRKTECPRAR